MDAENDRKVIIAQTDAFVDAQALRFFAVEFDSMGSVRLDYSVWMYLNSRVAAH